MGTRWLQLILAFLWRLLPTSALGNGSEASGVSLLVATNQENDSKTVICLASGNSTKSAMVWTAPIAKVMSEPVVKLDWKVKSRLDCDFSHQSCDTKEWLITGWTLVNSFDYFHWIQPFTDYRWEGLEEIRTSSPSFVTRELLRPFQSWEIGLSVRSKHDAHILLSVQSNPEHSSTLWIILGGWHSANSQKSVIRWCSEGVSPPDKFPVGECKIERSDHVGKFLSEYKWLHLKLSWDIRLRSLSVWRSGDEEPVLSFGADHVQPPTHISLQSRHGSSALWRLHDYNFMAADADSVLESPSFVPQLFPVEVVMLYAIIPPSNPSGVKVVLLDVNGGPVAAMEPIEDLVADGTWREARFIGDPHWNSETEVRLQITSSYVDFLIGSISEGKYFNGHLRMTEMTSWSDWTPACQILETDVLLSRTAAWASSGCPADYFMSDCSLKCSDVLRPEHAMCYGVTICRNNDGNPVCSCSPGHQGTFCQSECPPNKFGDRCQESCRRCKGTCDRFTGDCPEGCEDGYIEPDCEKTYPIMAQYPNVSATTNTITVTIDSLDHNGEGSPASFAIVLEEVDKSAVIRVLHESVVVLPLQSTWVFRDLKPAKWYRVRIVLYESSHHTYNGPLVPFTEVRLKCNAPRNITTRVSKTSVVIEWQKDVDTCPDQLLEYKLNGIVVTRPAKDSKQPLVLSALRPFTEYALLVRPSREELLGLETVAHFTTAQDAPSEATDLNVEKASAKNLHVTWARPKDIPGILQRYLVTYTHDGYRDCPRESRIYINSVTVITTKSDILLENLKTYSAYKICVSAETVETGPSVCVQGLTAPAGTPEEGPVALTQEEGCELSPTQALLRWTLPDACRGRGPVTSFLVTVRDADAREIVLTTDTTKPEVRVTGLRPGVWYDASVAAVRLLPNHEKELHLAFRTPTDEAGDGVFYVASQRHPYNLKMSNVSHDSIAVSWEKADNFSKIVRFSLEVSESMSYLLFHHVKKELKTSVTYDSNKSEYFYTVKDLLPSTVYSVTVRGMGDSENQSSILQMQTSMKDAHINENLLVDSMTTTTATLFIPPADQFVTKYSAYFVIVSSPELRSDGDLQWPDMPSNIRSEVTRAANISSDSLHWLAAELTPVYATSYFVVGGSSNSTQSLYSNGSRNVPLRSGRKHVLTLVLLNAVDWESRVVALSVGFTTLPDLQLGWLALLLLLPLAGYAIWMLRRRNFCTSNQFTRSSRSDTDAYSNIQEDE